MREILFRGKRKNNGEWVYGFLIGRYDPFKKENVMKFAYIDNGTFFYNAVEVIPETVGQYTGHNDVNGTKIFEGDIVKDVSCYLTHLLYVKHGTETIEQAEKMHDVGEVAAVEFCTEGVASCGCCYDSFYGSGFKAQGVSLEECEIVGNIYDNGTDDAKF